MKVLVVDDSAFMRKTITDMISSDQDLSVVGSAFDGVDALEKISKLHPDVVTLDVNMPRMDGLETLEHIMKEHPLPVIMLSSVTQQCAEETFKALKCGAVDYVAKPSGAISLDIGKVKEELVSKLKSACHAKPFRQRQADVSLISHMRKFGKKVILIGASTGGPPAIEEILVRLPEDIPPLLIVQHMPVGFTKHFAERLQSICKFEVKEGEEDDAIMSGRALIAPGGYHMTVGDDSRIHLDTSPEVNFVRPAADPLLRSGAGVFRSGAVGVILTGMGRDGADGIKAVKEQGGVTIAQDQASCIVFGMPKAAIEQNCVDRVLPLSRISQEIVNLCQM